jgi:molecular chaperone DnaK
MWALDLGTSNTLLARWDRESDRPDIVELAALCRRPGGGEPLQAPRAVPSAVHVLDKPAFLARHFSLGRQALVGRPALELNAIRPRPNFVPTFKRALGWSPLLNLAQAGGRAYTAREIARLFLRELLGAARKASGESIRELAITTPVESFEGYRAELAAIAAGLKIKNLSFLDEPVAAALGYGLSLARPRQVLVVDFGGGTLHLALVRIVFDDARAGRTQVLAKTGRDVGGDLVDRWLVEELCARQGASFDAPLDPDAAIWRRLALAEARRVKEALHFEASVTAELPARAPAASTSSEITRDDLVRILEERGLYRLVETCLRETVKNSDEVEDVLMVGGSTLLPGVYPMFEQKFGRGKVRAFQPFEAVAYGACAFAAGRAAPADFVVHDYALVTHDLATKQQRLTVVVPRGTPVPSKPDLWKAQLVPTCPRGEPEKIFKLVICEISQGGPGRNFAWDAGGQLHRFSADDAGEELVVKLNEANPALGYLDPPQSPSDNRPRLEVALGIDRRRWLCATVMDLRTGRELMRGKPVVQLL